MSSDCQHTPSPPQPAARPLEEEEDTATMPVKKGEGVNRIPRYMMAALVMMDSSRLEVPPKLFTTRATSMPAVGKARGQGPNTDHGRSYIYIYTYIYIYI